MSTIIVSAIVALVAAVGLYVLLRIVYFMMNGAENDDQHWSD